MADYELTTPDGTRYKVTAETEQQAYAALQKMLGAQPAEEKKPDHPVNDRGQPWPDWI